MLFLYQSASILNNLCYNGKVFLKKREGERIVEKFFKLNEKGSNVKTELIAGLTTFLAMAYILGVNPAVLADAGMDKASVFLATAISAGVASIIMGLVANYPVALASGMGVNALFAYTICGQMGFSWAAALSAVFISGIIFILISVTGVRKAIINAIPVQLKLAIGAGIGFFIAFVGLKNAGIIVASPSTFVTIGNLTDPTVLLAIVGLLITIALVIKNVPAACNSKSNEMKCSGKVGIPAIPMNPRMIPITAVIAIPTKTAAGTFHFV